MNFGLSSSLLSAKAWKSNMQGHCGLWRETQSCNFLRDSSKLSTEEIWVFEMSILALNYPPLGTSSHTFCILGRTFFPTRREFSFRLKLSGEQNSPPIRLTLPWCNCEDEFLQLNYLMLNNIIYSVEFKINSISPTKFTKTRIGKTYIRLHYTVDFWCGLSKQESPANAKGTRDSSACMKAHC